MRQGLAALLSSARSRPAALAAVAACVGTLALLGALQRPFPVTIDGEARTTWSHARTVAGVLRSAGVQLRPGDETLPYRNARVEPGDAILLRRAHPVDVHSEGLSRTITSASQIPANLLASAGVALLPGDQVWVDGVQVADPTLPVAGPVSRVRRAAARPVEWELDGVRVQLNSAAGSLVQALEETGERWYEADDLGADPAGQLAKRIEVRRSMPISVESDGTRLLLRAVGPTVADALHQVGLPLQGLDVAAPAADQAVARNDRIGVVRVRDEVLIEQEPISYETEFQPDPEGLIDTQTILDSGAYGIRANRVRVRKEDGAEVARQVEGEWVAREPEPRVVGYGTKIELKTLDTEYGPLQYYRAVPMYATSYSPCRLGIAECDNITASGAILKKGIAAVLVRWYRYMVGSQVYIPGYGIATIADTGGGIPGRYWIDLGYEDHDYQSWHDWVTVYFLAPVPANPMWVLN